MTPIKMSEDIKFAKEIEIESNSFNKWTYSVLPFIVKMPLVKFSLQNMHEHGIKIGKKYLYNRLMPKTRTAWRYESLYPFCPPIEIINESELVEVRTKLNLVFGKQKGYAMFTGAVGIPVLADEFGDPWMSLTPNEVISQRPGIKKARGNVIIGGCGLGWFARRCLERKQVKHVTLVDNDDCVLDFFGSKLKEEFGDRLTLVHDDIYNLDHMDYDSYLSDIWPAINDKFYDYRFLAIAEEHPNAWGWGYKI